MGSYLDIAKAALHRRSTGKPSTDSEQSSGWHEYGSGSGDRPSERRVAIRIESREYGTLWLVSTEAERRLADAGEPTYTIEEARRIIGLREPMVRQIHEFKKAYGCRVESVEERGASSDIPPETRSSRTTSVKHDLRNRSADQDEEGA